MIAVHAAKVLCVCDEPLVVEGLRSVLGTLQDLVLAGSVPGAENVVEEATRLRPDLILLDIEGSGRDVFEAAMDLHTQCRWAKLVFLSASVHDQYVSDATRAHAAGYFSKREPSQVLLDGLRRILAGERVFSPRVLRRCVPCLGGGDGAMELGGEAGTTAMLVRTRLETLTTREREVLRMIGHGFSRACIAQRLCRSPKTIDGHRERLMQKLDIHTTAELVRFSIREGLAEA